MTKAMILAAGRGERMRPLTDQTPKPLLKVGGEPLIGWHIRRLRDAGMTELVINHAWLGEQIEAWIGDGSPYQVKVAWSAEETALDTAGGIANALPLLGNQPFVLINADILTDIDFQHLSREAAQLDGERRLAHLAMVKNPAHHPQGDFSVRSDGLVERGHQLTYAGAAAYHPAMFKELAVQQPIPAKPLLPLLLAAMELGQVTGYCHQGLWLDVGTVDRLASADSIASRWGRL